MEVKIGMRQVSRELTVDTEQGADEVRDAWQQALAADGLLEIPDTKGNKVVVRAASVAYLDLGKEGARRVGFGAV
ncbi:DUF3107 domain-containing protein [Naumannella huperziae]